MPQEAAAVLGARDDYLRAMTDLERSARMRIAEPVDEARLAVHMAGMALPWTDGERARLQPVLQRLEQFLGGVRWRGPSRMLLIKAADAHEEALPHSRGAAIVLPESFLGIASERLLSYVLSHEAFHILSRADPKLREEAYGAIGFRPCAKVEIPGTFARRRVTNPDAVENRHVVSVIFRGRSVEALPYTHFAPDEPDPRRGLKSQARTTWLLVERGADGCRALREPLRKHDLQGLDEQIGTNTAYTDHPDEIVADNFALLFLGSETPPSPEVLDRLRRILLR